MIHTPIFVFESCDLYVFASPEDASRYLEPIDVEAGVFEAYDASGNLIDLATDGKRVLLRMKENRCYRPEDLANRLRTYLVASGLEVAAASAAELSDLIRMAEHACR